MKFQVQKFLEISTIHGLFYVSKKFHVIVRIFWIIALCFSVICTSILIAELVIKVQNIPVIVFESNEPISVSEIYFPAVTACPHFLPFMYKHLSFSKHDLESQYLFGEAFETRTRDERKIGNFNLTQGNDPQGNFTYFLALDQLERGELKPEGVPLKVLKRLQVVDLIARYGTFSKINYSVPTDDFLDVINEFPKEFRYPFSDNFQADWPDDKQVFYEHFYVSEIITPYGLCFASNMALKQDLMDVSLTSGDFHYQVSDVGIYVTVGIPPEKIPPRKLKENLLAEQKIRTRLESAHAHLVIRNDFDGNVILLHDPFELPSKNSRLFKAQFYRNTHLLIEPQKITIDESLHDLEPADRNCYLDREKSLKLFKVYTKDNCENECLTEYMISRCGCVEFFMIRNFTTRVCSASEKSCFDAAQEAFKEHRGRCKCLERCNYIKYEYRPLERGYTLYIPNNGGVVTTTMSYTKSTFSQTVRKKHFNELDFLSFVGGILGLFAGFSALSFVELVYWFTIRFVIENFKRKDTRVRPVDDDLQNGRTRGFFWSFFADSSIHGLKYIVEFTKIDSILWLIFIVTSLTICTKMIRSANQMVPNSRIVVYDDELKFNDKIPLPAFTFVPLLYHPQYNESEVHPEHSTMREKFERNRTMEIFCSSPDFIYYYDAYNSTELKYNFDILREQSRTEWFSKQFVSLNGKYLPQFAEIRTSRGLGFTFNMIDADELFNFDETDNYFNYTRNITTHPAGLQRIPSTVKYPLDFDRNDRVYMTVKITYPDIDEIMCLPPSFYVHNSDDNPIFHDRGDFINFYYGMTVDVEIIPEVIKTDESLRKLRPEERDCYFEGERTLRQFKKYSQRNCETECMADQKREDCGCVGIYQPFQNATEICYNKPDSLREYGCSLHSGSLRRTRNCSCLPMCNSISYRIVHSADCESMRRQVLKEAVINVKMNMDEVVLYRKVQQFTFSDVVSYIGGLLGLFAGISMLSIVEVFYFFTVRLGVNFLGLSRANGAA